MVRITSGISQIGGKFRLLNTILTYIPYHEFYLEPFLGSAIILLNKPRCRYECGNDLNGEIINYLLQVREYPEEFDQLKQGVFGLVSQEICNHIVRGELQPKNDIERAYFFYYLNKLTFAGSPQKGNISTEEYKTGGGYHGIVSVQQGGFANRETDVNKAKAQYSGMLNNFALGTIKEKQCNEAKASYKGLQAQPNITHAHTKRDINKTKERYQEIKASYRGITPKNVNFGLINNSRSSQSGKGRVDNKEVDKAKNQYNAQIKGINPKTTRPYTNNDCGLLSPLNPEAIKRLRYVNLTAYPFDKVYTMFYKAFHERKGLGEECFCYFDPPYPATEKYYGTGFGQEEHDILIKFLQESPFHWLLSIGGECEFYVDELSEFNIIEAEVKYSTSANHQTSKKEYLIMNYDINELPLMTHSKEQKGLSNWI